jgi:hypothetical protein
MAFIRASRRFSGSFFRPEPQADFTACARNSLAYSSSGFRTAMTTWPLVAIQPSGWMTNPVPFSPSGSGLTL